MGLTWTFRIAAAIATIAFAAVSARADILLDQPPGHVGGPGADTAFYDDLGFASYEITADDFQFSVPAEINHIRYFGFYGGNFSGSHLAPLGSETMRVRFYDDTGPEGLPGVTLFEQITLNPARVLTGQMGCGVCS